MLPSPADGEKSASSHIAGVCWRELVFVAVPSGRGERSFIGASLPLQGRWPEGPEGWLLEPDCQRTVHPSGFAALTRLP